MTRRDLLRRGAVAAGALGATAAFLNSGTAFAATPTAPLLGQTPPLGGQSAPTSGSQSVPPFTAQAQTALSVGSSEAEFDPNLARTLVIGALAAAVSPIPGAGPMVAALIQILWPASGTDVWGQIKGQVEALVNQKIADYNYRQVTEDLQGLKNVLQDYAAAVSDKNPRDILTYFISARTAIEAAEPHFVDETDAVPLLPLMAQLANLHLGLLREGYRNGKDWGMNDAELGDLRNSIQEWVTTYTSHAQSTFKQGIAQAVWRGVILDPDPTHSYWNAWTAQNAYVRGMTLSVLDFAFYWPSFNPTANLDGDNLPALTREIYSDPIGYRSDVIAQNDLWHLAPPPSGRMTDLRVWGSPLGVTAAQVAYGGGWGPVMGPAGSGNTSEPPYGWSGVLSADSPIVSVKGYSCWSMQLLLKNGVSLGPVGYPGNPNDSEMAHIFNLNVPSFEVSYPGEFVSSIRLFTDNSNGSTGTCIVFGFTPDQQTLRLDLVGARIQETGTQEVYLINDNGMKCHIPDVATLDNLFVGGGIQERSDVIAITPGTSLTSGAYLARAVDVTGQPIYLVDGPSRYHIASPAAFEKYGFDFGKVRNVPWSELEPMTAGPQITANLAALPPS